MKKLATILAVIIIIMIAATSVSAADLSVVLPAVNAGEADALDNFSFDNPLIGWIIPDVLRIEFDLRVTGNINTYGSIFCFHNNDAYGRVALTMGGGLFFNNWSGYWFDAGLHNSVYDNILSQYADETIHVKMTFDYDTFAVYLNDELAYDANTLKTNLDSAGAFYGEGLTDEYLSVITYICMRETLDFGYNSWWISNSETVSDTTNADIADFSIYCDDKLVATYFAGGEVGNNVIHVESEYESPETDAPETKAPET